MSKETFLKELQQHLAVLEDQEQQDILQEYSQHLDIKIQNGQKEEDAIRDFGPVKELAAEILEAYHVKPEFGEGGGGKRLPGLGSVNLKEGERKLRLLGISLGKKLAAFFRKIGKFFRKAGRGIRALCRRFLKLFRRREEVNKDDRVEGTAAGNAAACADAGGSGARDDKGGRKMEMVYEGRTAGGRSFGMVLSGFCKGAVHGTGALIFWCLRMLWNAFWLLMTVFAGCTALLALFGFGTFLVLMLQAYPLKGGVLVCLGGFLAGGSLACLCFSLTRWKRQKEEEKYQAEKASGRETEWEADLEAEVPEAEDLEAEAPEMESLAAEAPETENPETEEQEVER